MKVSFQVLIVAAALAGACSKPAGDSGGPPEMSQESAGSGESEKPPAPLEADNTGQNIRDWGTETLTPELQGSSKPDIELTRRIRRALDANDELSLAAKNIKIITLGGNVTLRGPVNSDAEKQLIEKIVRQQGLKSFDNQLEVKASE